ncbi:hypothetical protein Hanom_Chr10g00874101 [Helianthus anomalus]
MAINTFFHLLTVNLIFTLYVSPSVSSDPAGKSLAPAPQLGSDDPVSPPVPSAVSPSAGSPSSPPPTSDLTPSQSLSPAPASDNRLLRKITTTGVRSDSVSVIVSGFR